MENRFLRDVLLIAVVGAATLLPFLGQGHAVSSHEIRHAEIAREMAQSGNFLIPTLLGHPYRDKPPVLSAAIAILFRSNGEPSIALARLPCAVAAVAGAILLLDDAIDATIVALAHDSAIAAGIDHLRGQHGTRRAIGLAHGNQARDRLGAQEWRITGEHHE